MHQLQISGRRMVDETESIDDRLAWELRRDRNGEVEPSPTRIDASAKRSASETELTEQPRIGEIDRCLSVGCDSPYARLVIGHEQVACAVEREIVPHGRVPVAGVERRWWCREHIKCGPLLTDMDAQNATVHIGDKQLLIAAVIPVERESPEAHRRVRHG